MKILIVTQYFWPENFKINELAVELTAAGHQVTVLTGKPNYPNGKFFHGYSFLKSKTEQYHNITIKRVPLFPRGKNSSAKLILNYLSFAVFASILAPFYCRGKFDNIFVFEPSPVTVGIPAVFLKKLKKCKLFFWVQDLWPESLIATGATKSPKVIHLFNKLTTWIYKNCDKVLIQCEGFRSSIQAKNVPARKIKYFPNWADKIYKPYAGQALSFIPVLFPAGFNILFAGNLGVAQSLGTIVQAAIYLRDHTNINFVILGDGRQKKWLKSKIAAHDLKNIHLMGRHPAETMPYYFAMADALLVTLKKEPIFSITIPSKIQAYLACGKPIIGALDGYGANLINESNAGYSSPAEDAEPLAQNILKCAQLTTEQRNNLGNNAQLYSSTHFDRDKLISILISWMQLEV